MPLENLGKFVRGDLDWIVMRALEKERARRYDTANSLADDVRRFLDDEPVSACPPSSFYRFRKFASRYRTAVVMGSLVAAALIAGFIGTGTGLISATLREEAEYAQGRSRCPS